MRFFEKKDKKIVSPVQTVPSYANSRHPFVTLDRYVPLSNTEICLYEALREAVPIIDASICKIVRLVGGFNVLCSDKIIEKQLNKFLTTIQVNSCSIGAESFISTFLDQLLTYGTAVGEMVPNIFGNDIGALYNASLKDIELRLGENPLDLEIFKKELGAYSKIQNPNMILISVLNPTPGEIYGNSILKGLPFVSNILLNIYNSIGATWERLGNIRFAVTYKPGSDAGEKAYAKERAMQIADQWSNAMRSKDVVSDFIAVGDVSIKVIGADNQILDSQVPVRQMIEQIVGKLGIPPFLLGLSWSTSERMSSQQADILTSELEAYRRILTPVISKICSMWMRITGRFSDFIVNWDNINLQDEVELANARLITARANEIEKRLN